jgi:glutamate formiminotransferase/formiminotetrahydrofolate cyclodeaminase
MVGKLTYGKKRWESLDSQMRRLIPVVDTAAKDLISTIDADTNAFNQYMVDTLCLG